MARRSRSRFIRPAPCTKMWIGTGIGSSTVSSDASTLLSTLSAGALALRPFTILRTRMWLLFSSDQEAADESPFGTYAKIVVTDTAAAIGITAVPNPSGINGDPEASWFVWQAMAAKMIIDTASGVHGVIGLGFEIDSKSMRKVGPDDDVATVLDTEAGGGVTLVSNGRMLIQLH